MHSAQQELRPPDYWTPWDMYVDLLLMVTRLMLAFQSFHKIQSPSSVARRGPQLHYLLLVTVRKVASFHNYFPLACFLTPDFSAHLRAVLSIV